MTYTELVKDLHILYAEFYEMFSSFTPEDPGFICLDVAHTAFEFLFDALDRYDEISEHLRTRRKFKSSHN